VRSPLLVESLVARADVVVHFAGPGQTLQRTVLPPRVSAAPRSRAGPS
jgi:hypothetical protein